MDVQRLQDSFARMAMHGDAVPLFFYSDLFLRHPETRDLFPISMAAVRAELPFPAPSQPPHPSPPPPSTGYPPSSPSRRP